MQKRILVASVHRAFGELLRLSFEERGGYTVRLAASCEKAQVELDKSKFDLLVVDVDEKDQSLPSALPAILKRFPRLPLLVFPPRNDPQQPVLQGVAFQAWVKKPFYLPDLLAAAEAAIAGGEWSPAEQPEEPVDYSWLQEIETGGWLASLFARDHIDAVFLTPGGEIIAQAGGLPAAAGEEVAALISRSWRAEQTSDLARYIRLDATGAVVLLYVTQLEKSLLAALLFSAETPLMQARAAAGQSVQELRRLRRTGPSETDLPASEGGAGGEPAENLEGMDDRLLELLESAPSPDPFRIPLNDSGEWLPGDSLNLPDQPDFAFPWESDKGQTDSWLEKVLGNNPTEQALPDLPPAGAAFRAESRLEGAGQVYTCILVPRLAEQRLEGGLADALRRWTTSFCESVGWNLLNLQIAPEAFQWTMEASVNIVPGSVVRVMRKQSSQHIYSVFPQYARAGADDFWATGFLIVSGKTPPAPHLLNDFIQRTRRRQGGSPE